MAVSLQCLAKMRFSPPFERSKSRERMGVKIYFIFVIKSIYKMV